VDSISATAPLSPSTGAGATNTVADLGSEDFFKLLITQLMNQDPLTDSLQLLTGQQRFSSASSLIGRYVTGIPDADGTVANGMVVGIRFATDGRPMLQLASGVEISIDQVATIESAQRAAEALIGQTIIGVDQRDSSEPELIEGRVTAVRVGDGGEILLELDTGEDLRFRDFVGVTSDDA